MVWWHILLPALSWASHSASPSWRECISSPGATSGFASPAFEARFSRSRSVWVWCRVVSYGDAVPDTHRPKPLLRRRPLADGEVVADRPGRTLGANIATKNDTELNLPGGNVVVVVVGTSQAMLELGRIYRLLSALELRFRIKTTPPPLRPMLRRAKTAQALSRTRRTVTNVRRCRAARPTV